MTKKRSLLEALAVLAGLAAIGLLLRISYDAAIIASALLVFALAALFRPARLSGWIPAILVSAIWILASGRMYSGYNVFKLELFGLTLFPMIAWPTGLAFAYLYVVPLFTARPWPLRWLHLAIAYSVGIILAEWLGYNFLGVHLDAGNAYPGWPVLNIFHCPWWMQLAYFANGIAFMGIAAWMERERDKVGQAPAQTSASS